MILAGARRLRTHGIVALILVAFTTLPARAADDAAAPAQSRPRLGVAFGGGSARGLSHVGIVRWFEEHRIPIDVIAGTSMGGLIGGAIASGMTSAELATLLGGVNWDEMFGSLPFQYKNIRRKEDARVYPSRIEFGLKNGLSLPIALNNGQQVDFLLTRIAGPYGTVASFDTLPTPFRAVAVDLLTAKEVVLDKGSLSSALRATMSLPGVFPPVERDGMLLVDGGALNNVPADVVRRMGADMVIAISVGASESEATVNRSLLGLMSKTISVMMEANSRASIESADLVIRPDLDGFDSLDWRRSEELIATGYQAAEAMKDKLLPLAVSETEWAGYLEQRQTRRQSQWPAPQFVTVEGATSSDQARIEAVLAPLVGQKALDVAVLESTLETFAGLDRYETVGWQLAEQDGRTGLLVQARPKAHAPPFLMLGVNLQNTTSDDFAFQLAARYLTFDIVGAGSELRVDGAIGAQPRVGAELYLPFGRSPLFVTGTLGAEHRTLSFVSDDVVTARYGEDRSLMGFDGGVNLGRDSDVRIGMSLGYVNANVDTGDPGLPELDGREVRARLMWRHDGQDSPVVPSHGVHAVATLEHILSSPDAPPEFSTDRSNDDVTRAEILGSVFRSVRTRNRAFLTGAAGTTWGHPLATEQFALGLPFRLGAYNVGELRGDNYGVLSAGYLHAVGRLPDFLGGPFYLGGWTEFGSVFDDIDDAKFRTNLAMGAIADTIIGPVLLGGAFDFDGAWRFYFGVGRLF